MVDLTRVVDFYCTAMENFEICRYAYGIEVHEVKYEDLIGDFVNTSSALITFRIAMGTAIRKITGKQLLIGVTFILQAIRR